ncbi:MAG: lipoyl(octanoyl) transferase LipB, partial [Verrucomicrobia bacterium]|nr:lipoyl(octanoyl) transferase LipB [Verrucomicrobiota bacterium]
KQKSYVRDRIEGNRKDTLVYTEHLPVYTLGVRRGAYAHLIWNESKLSEKGIAVHKSNRGGDITYHGPGQLTGYPIISLEKLGDLHAYLRLMEDMLIQIVAHFGLPAGRREGKTGIWIETRKIAAIGVAVKSWVSYHGFALNVNNDLEPFSGIVPCGIVDGSVTSLKNELGFHIDLSVVKPIVSQAFLDTFKDSLT